MEMGLFTLHNYCALCLIDYLKTRGLKVDYLFPSLLVITVQCTLYIVQNSFEPWMLLSSNYLFKENNRYLL